MADAEDTIKIIEHLGGDTQTKYGWYKLKCVSRDHDDNIASAVVNNEEGAYRCFGCNLKAGSTVVLLQKVLGLDDVSARSKYEEIVGSPPTGVHTTDVGQSGGYDVLGNPKRSFEGGPQGFRRWLRGTREESQG